MWEVPCLRDTVVQELLVDSLFRLGSVLRGLFVSIAWRAWAVGRTSLAGKAARKMVRVLLGV